MYWFRVSLTISDNNNAADNNSRAIGLESGDSQDLVCPLISHVTLDKTSGLSIFALIKELPPNSFWVEYSIFLNRLWRPKRLLIMKDKRSIEIAHRRVPVKTLTVLQALTCENQRNSNSVNSHLSAHQVSSTVPSALHTSFHLILTTAPWNKY